MYPEYRAFFNELPINDDDWRRYAESNQYLEKNFNHTFERKIGVENQAGVSAEAAATEDSGGDGESGNTKEQAAGLEAANEDSVGDGEGGSTEEQAAGLEEKLIKSEDMNQAGVPADGKLNISEGTMQAAAHEDSVGDGESGNTEKQAAGLEEIVKKSKDLNQAGVPADDKKHLKETTTKKESLGTETVAGEGQLAGQNKKTEIDRRENTMWGLLKFRRDVHTHPGAMGQIFDLDESEIFLAEIVPDFLPKVIRTLLLMKKMTKSFATVWSNYKNSKSDPRRLPPNVVKTWR